MPVRLQIRGLEQVKAAMAQFPDQIQKAVGLAQKDITKNILDTKGLRNYPPSTSANQPPGNSGRGYYIRGRGWMAKSRSGYKLVPNSQRLGTKWYTTPNGFSTKVGNPTTYAPYLHGDEQVSWAVKVGWRKLAEVAEEKLDESVAIYERHITALIKRLGLD